MIYLNNNATTDMPPIVQNSIKRWFGCGNPSVDKKSKKLIEDAKSYIAKHCYISQKDYEIIFTSCASESNSSIINSIPDKSNIIISEIEHNSILKGCKNLKNIKIKYAKPDKYGIITPEEVEKLIDKKTALISIMFVNNEIGAINPIKDIGRIAKKHNITFHTDAVQMFGKCRLNVKLLNVDALSASFHKLYGPPGIGLLILKKTLLNKKSFKFQPLIAGSQNEGLRGGTENVPYIAGSITAMKWNFSKRKQKNDKMCAMINYLFIELRKKFKLINYVDFNKNMLKSNNAVIVFYGYKNKCSQSCNTLLLSIATNKTKLCNAKMKDYLEQRKVIVGIGSACNAKNKKASHVLFSLGCAPILRRGTLRISLGDFNTMSDMRRFVLIYMNMINIFIKK